jgi:ABC-type branched-subunit amino acid transport system substrate-binding protein
MTTKASARARSLFLAGALNLIATGCGVSTPESESRRPAEGNVRFEREKPSESTDAAAQTDDPKRGGREIYARGISAYADEIVAVLNENVRVPAAVVPCANCHGVEGSGKTEGGLVASDITWDSLTRPYEVSAAGGRTRVAYDDASLRRAVTLGFDSSGNVLQAGMPRYQLSRRDIDKLVGYLKQLGRVPSPGVTDSAVRIGVILPPAESEATARAAKEILVAYFGEVNRDGGIYGRVVEPRFCTSHARDANRTDTIKDFCEHEQPFALVGVPMTGAVDEISSWSSVTDIPLIVPLAQLADTKASANRYVFYLTGGVDRQTRALVEFAGSRGLTSKRKIGLVTGDDPVERKLADQAAGELLALGTEPLQMSIGRLGTEEIASRMKTAHVGVVFSLVTGEGIGALLRAAQKTSWEPIILALGANLLGVVDSLPAFLGELYIALPFQPADQTEGALRAYRELVARHGLTDGHDAIRIPFLASARILVEGLKGVGRRLNREALINALERPGGYSTGLMPPVSYRDGRRIGAPGVSIVQVRLDTRTCREVEVWDGSASKGDGVPSR